MPSEAELQAKLREYAQPTYGYRMSEGGIEKDVFDGGRPEGWHSSPRLAREAGDGWTASTIKPGDRIVVAEGVPAMPAGEYVLGDAIAPAPDFAGMTRRELKAFADEHEIDVDKRAGQRKLAEALSEAWAARA